MTSRMRSAPARFSLVWLMAVVLGITAAQRLSMTQAPVLDIPAAVADTVATDGSARVIVGVRTSFVPEGYLGDQASVADQRTAMQAAVDGTMGRAAAAGA